MFHTECPCGSGRVYDACCGPLHRGTAQATSPDPGLIWTRLEVLDATGDEVEFVAHFDSPAGPGSLHERSVFEQRGGRWVYVGISGA